MELFKKSRQVLKEKDRERKERELERKRRELVEVKTRLGQVKEELQEVARKKAEAEAGLSSPEAVSAVVKNPLVVKGELSRELKRLKDLFLVWENEGLTPPKWVKYLIDVAVTLIGVVLLWNMVGADRIVGLFDFLDGDDESYWTNALALLIDGVMVFGLVQAVRSLFTNLFVSKFDKKAWTVGVPIAIGTLLIVAAVLVNLWWLSKVGV